jgi:hypothetical protein
MKKLKFNYKFTNYDLWFRPPEFQQIRRFGLIGRRIGEVNIVNENEPRLDSIEEALVCQVCNCLKENDQPLEILLFTDYLEDYSKFINQKVTADLGSFYCPAWQEIPTYQVVGLRIVGE